MHNDFKLRAKREVCGNGEIDAHFPCARSLSGVVSFVVEVLPQFGKTLARAIEQGAGHAAIAVPFDKLLPLKATQSCTQATVIRTCNNINQRESVNEIQSQMH